MKIAWRPSGGRGEYELAGRSAGVGVEELLDLPLRYEVAPSIIIPGHAATRRRDGKPRIRLDEQRNFSHPHLVLAATLLLPRPIRELRKTGDSPLVLQDGQYTVHDIDVDVVDHRSAALLRPTVIYARNTGESTQRVDFAKRMALVARLWDIAATTTEPSPLGTLLLRHRDAVKAGDHKGIEKAASLIQAAVGTEADVMPRLLTTFGVVDNEEPEEDVDLGVTLTEGTEGTEDDETPPLDASRRQIIQWRMQAVRGAQGRKFSAAVKDAYRYRCAFSGSRLPKTAQTVSSGVDAAHILPWAEYELNSVKNGLCLNKLCHWAFDAGVLRLDYVAPDRKYILTVPPSVKGAAAPAGFDLGYFVALEGPILPERLPDDRRLWPAESYLAALNAKMFPS